MDESSQAGADTRTIGTGAPPPDPGQDILFDLPAGPFDPAFCRMMLRHLLLSAATLLVYRFWARAAERRFLWARVRIDGDPLEYTGQGHDLFLGFMRGLVVAVPLLAVLNLAAALLPAQGPAAAGLWLVAAWVMAFVLCVARIQRWRHLADHLRWRGIAFGHDGSARESLALGVRVATRLVATLGFAWPHLCWEVRRHAVERSRFGDRRFTFGPMARIPLRNGLLAVAAFWLAAGVLLWPPPGVHLPVLVVLVVPLMLFVLHARTHERAAIEATRLGEARLCFTAPFRWAGGASWLYILIVSAFAVVAAWFVAAGWAARLAEFADRLGPLAATLLGVAALLGLAGLRRALHAVLLRTAAVQRLCASLRLHGAASLATTGAMAGTQRPRPDWLDDAFAIGP